MPQVSVVIPVKENDPSPQLPELLEQLKRQTVECEILLMGGRGIGQARRRGVEQAKCDIIAFIDSDCLLPSDTWIEQMLAPFADPEVTITHTLGTFLPEDPMVMRYAVLSRPYTEGMAPGTGHTLVRKSAILEAGNFSDVPGCEDRLLFDKMDGKFVFMPGLEVRHFHAVTIGGFLTKQLRCKLHCDQIAKDNPHYFYNDYQARQYRNAQIRYNTTRFFRVFLGKEDTAWLLWPIMAVGQLFITRFWHKVWVRFRLEEKIWI